MKHLVYLTVTALLLAVFVSPAMAGGKKKKKNQAASSSVAGTVVSVTKGEGADANSTLTVRVDGAKKKAGATERKIELPKDAKLETLVMTKKKFGLSSAAVEDLKEGEHVLVRLKEGKTDQADQITLVSAKKKKKAAAQ